MHHVIRKPQRGPDGADFILEQVSKRLDQLEAKIGGEAANVVMGLDPVRIDGIVTRTFDHVGIERALCQEIDLPQGSGLALEDLDEGRTDPPALLFRVDNPLQGDQELVAGVDALHVDAQMPLHHVFHPAPLVAAEEPIVNQQAGELAGERAMHQRGAHRRVDATRERAEDASVAHLFANRGGRLLDEGGRFPGAAAGRHLIEKVPDNLATLWGMNDLRMKGDAEPPGIIGHGRDQ